VRTGFTGAITLARTLERMMPVRVLIAVLIVLFVCLLAAAVDRAIKTTKRNRRRLDATRRLAAAAAQGEAQHRRGRRPNRSAARSPRSCRPSTTSTPATWTSQAEPPRPDRAAVAALATSDNGSVQVVVLADTHAPRRWRVCPPRVAEHLRTADRILHAGDVCTAAVLAELAEYAPVTAVLGNNDGPDVAEWGAPRTAELDLDGLKVSMVHDSGAAAGRLTRLRRRFPGADLVVFGHSHIPLDESAPGAPGGPGTPRD
jgi:Predicted phosphoesterase